MRSIGYWNLEECTRLVLFLLTLGRTTSSFVKKEILLVGVCVCQFLFSFSVISLLAAPPTLTLSLFLFFIFYPNKTVHVWTAKDSMWSKTERNDNQYPQILSKRSFSKKEVEQFQEKKTQLHSKIDVLIGQPNSITYRISLNRNWTQKLKTFEFRKNETHHSAGWE